MSKRRVYFLFASFAIWVLLIWGRLFYWQIILGSQLAAAENRQSITIKQLKSPRGEIFAADNSPLVLNEKYYNLYLWRPILNVSEKKLLVILGEIFFSSEEDEREKWLNQVRKRLVDKSQNWILLKKEIENPIAKRIEKLQIKGLSLDLEWGRFYPEGSSSAHLLGFLGKNSAGKEKGYFGLEGFYDRLLQGHAWAIIERQNWWSKFKNTLGGELDDENRDLFLSVNRTVQFIMEEELEKGIERYGAKSGWGIILNPLSGEVLGMASWPKYDPAAYYQSETELFSNPVVSTHFEPGSIFKPVIVAAALQEKSVNLDSQCPACSGPVKMGEYQIETWDNKYYPQTTVKEIIQHSDNVGMVWIGQELGKEQLLSYLDKFGFGKKTEIDLEGEAVVSLKKDSDWYPIDLATVTFGQGIAVTPIQMICAFAPFANGGSWLKPRVVAKIKNNGSEIVTNVYSRRVIDEKVAEEVKELLINAVESGEAKWTKIPEYTVAGKTGTAQIPIRGHYDEEKTIASFIGFVPAQNPKFLMLVSLTEPTSSPWGAETAAPLWFKIAKRLLFYFGTPPSK